MARCYDVPDLSVQRLRTLSPIREVVVAVVVVVVVVVIVRLAKRRSVLRRGTVCDRDPWRCVWKGGGRRERGEMGARGRVETGQGGGGDGAGGDRGGGGGNYT